MAYARECKEFLDSAARCTKLERYLELQDAGLASGRGEEARAAVGSIGEESGEEEEGEEAEGEEGESAAAADAISRGDIDAGTSEAASEEGRWSSIRGREDEGAARRR
jgi:hypothetical protein